MTAAPARLRSLLFVPGDRPDRLTKALASGADGVVVDLEDAVAPARLPQARTAVAAALLEVPPARVLAMAFSSGEEGDFMADLGGRWAPDGLALQYARSTFLCDLRAVGDMLALDGVCMSLDDGAVLASECAIAATPGFDGKLAVHPSQIPVIHDAFTPSAADVDDAREVLSILRGSGGPAARRHRGRMIDAANARVAHRVLARAGRAEDGVHGG